MKSSLSAGRRVEGVASRDRPQLKNGMRLTLLGGFPRSLFLCHK